MTDHLSVFAAVDLGASSGRVVVAMVKPNHIQICEVHRFTNTAVSVDGALRWDVGGLLDETMVGLRHAVAVAAEHGAGLSGIGIDSWGVDFALGAGPRFESDHHRGAPDPTPMFARRSMTPAQVYNASGVLDQAINTAPRLAAREPATDPRLLFIPDLWVYALTGTRGTDPTIASTSQLLDAHTGDWSAALIDAYGLSWVDLPPVHRPGTLAGLTTSETTAALGAAAPIPVYRVAGHDTASAFAFATPARDGDVVDGLISSGTWSLVGTVLEAPHTTSTAMQAGFTNEIGIQGTLFLQNLNGMWVLQECLRQWRSAGDDLDVVDLMRQASDVPSEARCFPMADERLLGSGDMVGRVQQLCREAGRSVPHTPAEVSRAILESLANSYADGLRATAHTAGVHLRQARIVGGGARNTLLCQLAADATGLTVAAGPVEASSIGNLATQIVSAEVRPDLASVYADLQGAEASTDTYQPRPAATSGAVSLGVQA